MPQLIFLSSAFEGIFNLRFISFNLSRIGFTQADYSDVLPADGESDAEKTTFNRTVGKKAGLAVVPSGILNHDGLFPYEGLYRRKIDAVNRPVFSTLGFIPFIYHYLFVATKIARFVKKAVQLGP